MVKAGGKYYGPKVKNMDIEFEIVELIGVLTPASRFNSYAKEVNLVAWNGGEAKIDVREWNNDHTRMRKGLTLTKAEFMTLLELGEDYKNKPEEDSPQAEAESTEDTK